MDPVTHTLLGVAIGEAFFRPRLGRKAVVVSGWAANLPDLDTVVLLTGDPGAVILRRSFGHSLFLLPVWIAGLAWIFKRKYKELPARDLVLIIAVNCAGHLLFDLINSFGVQLFWPFSIARPELATTFIIDLALTGCLAAPHLARLSKEWKPRLDALCLSALAVAGIYLGSAFAARREAARILAREAGPGAFQYVFPEPLGAHRWRGVVKEGNWWRSYLVNVPKRAAKAGPAWPDDDSAPVRAARETPFGKRLMTFFKAPVWSAEPKPEGGWTVRVHDLRFVSLVLPRRTPFEYEFDAAPDGTAKPVGVRIW